MLNTLSQLVTTMHYQSTRQTLGWTSFQVLMVNRGLAAYIAKTYGEKALSNLFYNKKMSDEKKMERSGYWYQNFQYTEDYHSVVTRCLEIAKQTQQNLENNLEVIHNIPR